MRIVARHVAVLFILVAPLLAARGEGRRALLVGIDDYSASTLGRPPAGVPERGWLDLSGAVHDVEAMREMLIRRHGFQPADVVVLKNQAATRSAILQAIETHLERPARSGDVVLFYYSGHGSQVTNAASTEPDKRDETIVPADSRLGVPDITDKVLRRAFNRILDRGARVTVILDSCHSGSGLRGPAEESVRSVRPDPRPIADRAVDGPPPEARGALVISAAEDRQTARETRDDRGVARGVFTWALLRAMRRAAPGEPAIDTFLRAQGILRGESALQDPVLAGNAEARATPLLGTTARIAAQSVLAVEEVRADGTVTVQGGWANGLTVGSELRLAKSAGVRLEVKEMLGLGRCVARLLAPASVPDALTPGALLEIGGWASPPSRPLRVWMPRGLSAAAMSVWAEELARLARRSGIRWIEDPIEETPAYLLRPRNGGWELLGTNGRRDLFAEGVGPRSVLARIPRGSSFFTHFPAPDSLIKDLGVGTGTRYTSVQPVSDPRDADYLLTGRFVRGNVEYAWLRPLAIKADEQRSGLPIRTAWHSASQGADVLRNAVLQLRRIYAWQNLESPPAARSAYELVVRHRPDDAPVQDGVLVGNETYDLSLHLRPGAAARPRYFYAFMIDSSGRSLLLYPDADAGSVENRFPLDRNAPPSADIPLDTTFHATPPYGVDTYYLLTTDEPLPDPTILMWDGLRGRLGTPVTSPLTELLLETSDVSRSAPLRRTPNNWSIDRMLFVSIPPRRAGLRSGRSFLLRADWRDTFPSCTSRLFSAGAMRADRNSPYRCCRTSPMVNLSLVASAVRQRHI